MAILSEISNEYLAAGVAIIVALTGGLVFKMRRRSTRTKVVQKNIVAGGDVAGRDVRKN